MKYYCLAVLGGVWFFFTTQEVKTHFYIQLNVEHFVVVNVMKNKLIPQTAGFVWLIRTEINIKGGAVVDLESK